MVGSSGYLSALTVQSYDMAHPRCSGIEDYPMILQNQFRSSFQELGTAPSNYYWLLQELL
jgi:hypothetical protein